MTWWLAQYSKDYNQFLKTQTVPDFVFVIGGTGRRLNLSEVNALGNDVTAATWVFTNAKTQQYGTTGIAVCDFAHTHTYKSGVVRSFKEVLTSVFTFQNGKWMLASWHTAAAEPAQADEVAAIRKVIETETKLFHESQDRMAMLSYWKLDGDGRTVVSLPTQDAIVVKGTDMKAAIESGLMPKADNATFELSNFVCRASGNTAWATFDQKETKPDGSKIYFHSFRCLEKVNNEWKMVFSSVHAYTPK